MESFKANIAKIEADRGREAALQDGMTALNLPKGTDVSRYPPDVQNAIVAAGQGQRAGTNQVVAARVLASGGVSAVSPELSMTAQAVLKAGKIDDMGKVVPFLTMKPEEQEALSPTESQAAINTFEGNKSGTTPIFSKDYIYGLLPPAILANSKAVTAQQQKSIAKFSEIVANNTAAATSVDSMVLAMFDSGMDNEQVAAAVTDIANASEQHNNATRKYNLLGLPEQDGVQINYDPYGIDGERPTELDLTSKADALQYVITSKVRNGRANPHGFSDWINPFFYESAYEKDPNWFGK